MSNAGLVLNPDVLIAAAQAHTGLDDFGAPDVLEPLRHLTESLIHEACLNEAGIVGHQLGLERLLVNRLRFQKILHDHPQVRAEKIRGPIVIIGFPRSGTTKLQRMTVADPALQKIPFWRMLNPLPLADDLPSGADARIAIAMAATAYIKDHFPAFHAAHPMGALEAEEEDFLMEHSFATSATFSANRMPGYQAWVRQSDPKPFYDLLRLFLQYFQWQDRSSGRMWLLKATCHLHRLRWLLQAFPDATIVHCHRDPATSITSLTDMFCAARKITSDQVDTREVRDFTLAYSLMQMQAYFEQRPLLEKQHRFVDVSFKDIVARPFDVIEKIYAAANIELTDEARAAMRQWEQDNPQHKHGKREYTAEKSGYTETQLRSDFAPYVERFKQFL